MEESYIYKLECIKNGRVYIGKTVCPAMRKKNHMNSLRRGKHPIALMQADYERYGADAFVFTVIEKLERVCTRDENGSWHCTDSSREKELMIQFKSFLPEHGYNYKDVYFYPHGGKRKTNERRTS